MPLQARSLSQKFADGHFLVIRSGILLWWQCVFVMEADVAFCATVHRVCIMWRPAVLFDLDPNACGTAARAGDGYRHFLFGFFKVLKPFRPVANAAFGGKRAAADRAAPVISVGIIHID